jgi:hypothetical protein
MFKELFKEKINILCAVIVVAGLIFIPYSLLKDIVPLVESVGQAIDSGQKLGGLQTQISQVRLQAGRGTTEKAEGREIYEIQGMNFGAQASFAPLFESIVNTARLSGIRIRSIEYDYEPAEDMVFASRLTGYNVCQVYIVAIGSYTQFQNFFKGVLKEEYLNHLAEIELRPFVEDRSVLIGHIKLTLYTKEAGAAATMEVQQQPPQE